VKGAVREAERLLSMGTIQRRDTRTANERIAANVLMTHLLCARTANYTHVSVIELTAPQLSDRRVPRMVTVLRTPARPDQQFDSHVYMELELMKNLIARFVKDQSGATAIEYGLIAAGISLAIIAIVNSLGSNISGKFVSINTALK
jgi:pilus assembly protein Flp/PilA